MPHDVFISYASEDRERVRPIVKMIRQWGWSVWWDARIHGGDDYTDEIQQALDASGALIVFWSRHSVKRRRGKWVRAEARQGLDREILIPVRLDDVQPPLPFYELQTLALFDGWSPDRRDWLVRSLRKHLGEPKHVPRTEPEQPRAGAPPSPPIAPISTPPDAVEEPARPAVSPMWRRTAWVASALGVVAMAAWSYQSQAGEPREGARFRLQGDRPSPRVVEYRVDPETGCKVPFNWETVDATPGHDGWARAVREPGTEVTFQLIAPGKFWMGSPSDEEGRAKDETRHEVTLTYPYYLAKHEFTYGALQRLLGKPLDAKSVYPLAGLDWSMAQQTCERLGCRLPTEAEWEFAARGDDAGRFEWGDDLQAAVVRGNVLDLVADPVGSLFPFEDGYSEAAAVGRFPANSRGLQDMTGNVWEWCFDEYRGDYDTAPVVDPIPMPTGMANHVLRGGSFASGPDQCRVARRLPFGTVKDKKDVLKDQIGFRPALPLR